MRSDFSQSHEADSGNRTQELFVWIAVDPGKGFFLYICGRKERNKMKTHTVIDGNAFYEIDDECYARLMKEKEREPVRKQMNPEVRQDREIREKKNSR